MVSGDQARCLRSHSGALEPELLQLAVAMGAVALLNSKSPREKETVHPRCLHSPLVRRLLKLEIAPS